MADDFDAAYAPVARRRRHHRSANPFAVKGNRLVFFTDLDGNFLHLIERQKPLP